MLDRDLVSQLKRTVGDRLQEWITSAKHENAMVPVDDQRQFAIGLARDQLRVFEKERLVQGHAPMPADEFQTVVREVVAALFDAGGFTAAFDRPDMANLAVNGLDAYGELVTGEVIPMGRIAASTDEVISLVQQLLVTQSRTARLFNSANPLVSAQLANGMRLTACMEVSDTVSVSIRRSVIRHVSLAETVRLGTITNPASELFAATVAAELNILVGGGTNSGKTTLLRALCDEIPRTDRIVVIEDAAELNLKHPDRHPDVVSLEARQPNVEGAGEITLGQLCKHALRMSPKRIICGELRSGDEALPVLQAMTSGNDGSMSTIHARSAENSLEKLALLLGMAAGLEGPVAANLISQAIDIVVHLHFDRRSGKRLVTEIREITGYEGSKILTNAIFTRGKDGQLRPTGTMSDRLRERLADVGYDTRRLTIGTAA
jgi:pilus assembly protein CpaF